RIERPFFSVPKGRGGLTSYRHAAAERGVVMYRAIDILTGARPMFARSGIPGTVGTATCELWKELAVALAVRDRMFTVWPFEGALTAALLTCPIVLGEIYPRAAYATALLDQPVETRSRLSVAKTNPSIRQAAIDRLKKAEWIRIHRVALDNLDAACEGE